MKTTQHHFNSIFLEYEPKKKLTFRKSKHFTLEETIEYLKRKDEEFEPIKDLDLFIPTIQKFYDKMEGGEILEMEISKKDSLIETFN